MHKHTHERTRDSVGFLCILYLLRSDSISRHVTLKPNKWREILERKHEIMDRVIVRQADENRLTPRHMHQKRKSAFSIRDRELSTSSVKEILVSLRRCKNAVKNRIQGNEQKKKKVQLYFNERQNNGKRALERLLKSVGCWCRVGIGNFHFHFMILRIIRNSVWKYMY